MGAPRFRITTRGGIINMLLDTSMDIVKEETTELDTMDTISNTTRDLLNTTSLLVIIRLSSLLNNILHPSNIIVTKSS